MKPYGEEGTLTHPNFFGGEIRLTKGATPAKKPPKWEHPLGIPNQKPRRA